MDFASSQERGAEFPQIPPDAFARSVQFLEPNGRHSQGAEAVFRLLSYHKPDRWLLFVYEHFPGVRDVTEFIYQWVAGHRPFLTRWQSRIVGSANTSYWRTRDVYLKGLAIIYGMAFTSLAPQILGLVGRGGILPVQQVMQQVRGAIGLHIWQFPTLAWFGTSDLLLRLFCAAGVALAALLFCGILPALNALLLWVLYLSLVTIGGDFLSFQWDSLLLEAGLLGFLWAPWRGRRDLQEAPSRWVLWLIRLLLFRLMLQSGLVKLLSHDATWARWTALEVYYQTMPLPNALSWVMHQLPAAFQKLSVGFLFFVELLVPFLIFFRGRPRRFACASFIVLQVLILLTGNYAFFNWLTIVCSLTLLEDRELGGALPPPTTRHISVARWAGRTAVGAFLVALAFGKFSGMLGLPVPFQTLLMASEPFRSTNTYGLFAVMTTRRPEIMLEGSDDQKDWKAYDFRYKPQALDRRPPFVAPHQPRLDWQMWFAALGSYRDNPWFMAFSKALLEGSPAVLRLLRTNPFPDHPPRYLRASVFDYQFTTPDERKRTGNWWRREPVGLYCPILSLNS